MKLRVIDPNTGIKVWELSEFIKFRKEREKEEDIQPPPLRRTSMASSKL